MQTLRNTKTGNIGPLGPTGKKNLERTNKINTQVKSTKRKRQLQIPNRYPHEHEDQTKSAKTKRHLHIPNPHPHEREDQAHHKKNHTIQEIIKYWDTRSHQPEREWSEKDKQNKQCRHRISPKQARTQRCAELTTETRKPKSKAVKTDAGASNAQ